MRSWFCVGALLAATLAVGCGDTDDNLYRAPGTGPGLVGGSGGIGGTGATGAVAGGPTGGTGAIETGGQGTGAFAGWPTGGAGATETGGTGATETGGTGGTATGGTGATETGGTGATETGGAPPTGCDGIQTAPNGYCVNGGKVWDTANHEAIFHGVNRPSMEWDTNGQDMGQGDFNNMAGWGATIVRIPLNQCFWNWNQDNYQSTVQSRVNEAHNAGLAVLLDLHWSGSGCADQQDMADAESVNFWRDVANRFKDDGRVFFDLYNEPRVSCAQWRAGGAGWVGMQELYDTVRSTGAHNLVIVSGIDWGYGLRCVEFGEIQGYNIVYATHLYPFAHKQPADWAVDWAHLIGRWAVWITEFGPSSATDGPDNCGTSYPQAVVDFARTNGLSWQAWAWFEADACGFPSLISNYSGNPSYWGGIIRDAM